MSATARSAPVIPDGLFANTPEAYGPDYQAHLLEQYKLYVASANHVSDRRAGTNNYFLTVNTSLVTLYGLATVFDGGLWQCSISVAGAVVGIVWLSLIISYRNLNTAKFAVIHELEQHLPCAPYRQEWQVAKLGKGLVYRPLTHIEQWVPIVFVVLYVVLGSYSLMSRPPAPIRPQAGILHTIKKTPEAVQARDPIAAPRK